MAGSHQHVVVRSLREQQLSAHMLPPAFVDHSRSLRCPMPGQVSCTPPPTPSLVLSLEMLFSQSLYSVVFQYNIVLQAL